MFCGSAVPPLWAAITWGKCTAKAAVTAAVLGLACGIASWLAVAQIQNGAINIATTGLNPPLLAGNLFAFFVSAILVLAISFAFPAPKRFDWDRLKTEITTSDDMVKKAGAADASAVESEAEQAEVARIRLPVKIIVGVIAFLSLIVWPLLTLPAGVYRY